MLFGYLISDVQWGTKEYFWPLATWLATSTFLGVISVLQTIHASSPSRFLLPELPPLGLLPSPESWTAGKGNSPWRPERSHERTYLRVFSQSCWWLGGLALGIPYTVRLLTPPSPPHLSGTLELKSPCRSDRTSPAIWLQKWKATRWWQI